MKIENFYTDDDMPNQAAKKRMWSGIQDSLPNKKVTVLSVDRRSFIYGMVASFIVVFCSVGAYTTYRQIFSNGEKGAVKAEKAYQVAIKEFERAVPASEEHNTVNSEILEERKKHIALIDEEIANVHREFSSADQADIKQSKLRRLYRMKLSILLNMVENGEMEL